MFTVLQKQSKIRESLQNLQPASTDKENLIGAGRMLKADLPIKDTLKKYLDIFIYFYKICDKLILQELILCYHFILQGYYKHIGEIKKRKHST